MLLEVLTVSRKTPSDGKLEITAETARRLAPFAARLQVTVGEQRAPATVMRMRCICEKRAGEAHEHQFLASEVMRALPPNETVVLELSPDGEILVARPHPL